jgi:hypothetical protein
MGKTLEQSFFRKVYSCRFTIDIRAPGSGRVPSSQEIYALLLGKKGGSRRPAYIFFFLIAFSSK